MAPKNYYLEHTKPIFNEHEILNLSNLYVHQPFLTMYKVMKDHTPIAIYDMFKMSSRDNFLVKLPSVHLNVSQCNFVSRCSLLWNKLIGKVMEKVNQKVMVRSYRAPLKIQISVHQSPL